MGILLAIMAGLFVPLANLSVRKSIDVAGSAKAYFVVQMAASFLFALALGPLYHKEASFPLPALLLGALAGCILSLMLYSLGKAVEKGPPGLTFAILNSATVLPGLLMALVFGEALGFAYNGWHAAGSLFVLLGLFWGAISIRAGASLKSWAYFCIAMFVFHIALLSLFQWRAMLMHNTTLGVQSEWFMPAMFFTSGLIQLSIYLKNYSVWPNQKEVAFGVIGGLTNLLCTFFLIRATVMASALENAIIFPVYSIMGIVLTNLWGQKLYQEKVNWKACQLCAFGLLVGTVDWKTVIAYIF